MSTASGVEGLRTQVSGRYSPDNPGVFELRQRLVAMGMDVRFPAGDSIVEYVEGFAITTPEERAVAFHDTELAFLDSIRKCDLHIVYNLWASEEGYIGESTAVETIRAMSRGVPTVWLRPPGRFSPSMSRDLRIFTTGATHYAYVEALDTLPDAELATSIGRLAAGDVSLSPYAQGLRAAHTKEDGVYHGPPTSIFINDRDEEMFFDVEDALLAQYSEAWGRYQAADRLHSEA